VAASARSIAGSLFGGVFNAAKNAEYDIQRAIGGKAHDSALETAVAEGKVYFKQCGRCGKWVCPEVCWNGDVGQCDGCAPKLAQEMASGAAQAQANAARQQLQQKAAQQDYVSGVDLRAGSVLKAPGNAPNPAAGGGAGVGAMACSGCHAPLVEGSKFCAQCGTPQKPPGCPACGNALQANARFCAQCGHKMA
jgi:hypothetical protein